MLSNQSKKFDQFRDVVDLCGFVEGNTDSIVVDLSEIAIELVELGK